MRREERGEEGGGRGREGPWGGEDTSLLLPLLRVLMIFEDVLFCTSPWGWYSNFSASGFWIVYVGADVFLPMPLSLFTRTRARTRVCVSTHTRACSCLCACGR